MPDVNVIGVVPNRPAAEQLVGNLRLANFDQEAISVIMVTRDEPAAELEQADDQRGEGSAVVAKDLAIGAGVGGATGILAGLATLAIPGLGPIIGSGVLLALFGGSGAFVGALSGAFASENVSSEVINRYGMALREGQTLVSVTAHNTDEAKRAEEVMNAAGASNVNSYMEGVTDITDTPGVNDVSE